MRQFQRLLWISFISLVIPGCKKSNGDDPVGIAIHSISPAAGGKSTVVRISGYNFSANASDNQVYFNGHAAIVSDATDSTLTVTVPAGAGTGYVVVQKGSKTAKGPIFSYEFNYYTVTTLAGSIEGYADGIGTAAQFGIIQGIACDKDGNVIVADHEHHMIRRIAKDSTVTTLAGAAGPGYIDGPAQTAQFTHPIDVVVDKSNNIYVADMDNNKIRELIFSPSGYKVITLAGDTTAAVSGGFTDGIGSKARFSFPTGVAVDTVGNLYVADRGNYAIRRISLQDTNVVTIAGTGQRGHTIGQGAYASFGYPFRLDVDPIGTYALIADLDNRNIYRISPLLNGSGSFVRPEMAANPSTSGYQDGAYATVKFSTRTDIAIDDPRDRVFIADFGNLCIRVADTKKRTITTLTGGPGRPGFTDGPLATASFTSPNAIAMDRDGNIYIADFYRVRKIAYE